MSGTADAKRSTDGPTENVCRGKPPPAGQHCFWRQDMTGSSCARRLKAERRDVPGLAKPQAGEALAAQEETARGNSPAITRGQDCRYASACESRDEETG
jgi:hypothetical protein